MQFPLLTISGDIVKNPAAEFDLTLPMLTLAFEGGGELKLNVPIFTAVIEAHVDPIASIGITLPRWTLEATALTTGSGIASVSLPALTISATASQSPIASLSKNLPMLLLSATGTVGYVASLERPYPSLKLSASASWLAPGTISIELPPWTLEAYARTVKVGLSFNPRNMAFSNYSAFDYNSIAYFNGKTVAVTRTGLYELSDDVDNGTAIEWKLRTGQLDIAHNHLRQVWITGKFDAVFKVVIEDIEGNRYEYEAHPWSDDPNEVRVKLGKAIRTRYAILELSGDSAVEVDKIRLFGVQGGMKR
jgi:hypothetical protein